MEGPLGSEVFTDRAEGEKAPSAYFLIAIAVLLIAVSYFPWDPTTAQGLEAPAATPTPAPCVTYAQSTPAFDFTEIATTGTFVPLADDQVSLAVPIGFMFRFFGIEYSAAYISSNGFVSVLPGLEAGCCSGQVIPTAGAPNGIISGWWEDFNSVQGNIRYQTVGLPGSRVFIVEFDNVGHWNGEVPVKWQIKLFEGSNTIEAHYPNAASNGGTHSAGIENQTGTAGYQFYFGTGSIPINSAVRYTPNCGTPTPTPPPPSPTPVASPTPTPMGDQPAILAASLASNQTVVFPDAYSPSLQQLVAGQPSGANPHGVTTFGRDHALVGDGGNSRVFVIQLSSAAVVSTINTAPAGYDGYGTIAVSPDQSVALAMSGSSLRKIHAPFNESSVISSATLPGTISTYQTQAIVFDNAGRAFVYHSNGISVLDAPYTSIAFTVPVSGNSSTGSIAITPDGNTILTTTLRGDWVQIFNAPFSAASTATILTIPGASSLNGIAVAPDGSHAIVVSGTVRHAASIAAPFSNSSEVAVIPLAAGGGTRGFEDVGISADSRIAILTGSGPTDPAVHISAPFGALSLTSLLPLNGVVNPSRGSGAVRFLPPGLAPGLTISASAPATVAPGGTLTYEMNFANTGTRNASDVVIRVPVPPGTTFHSAIGGQLIGQNVVFNIGTVAAGSPLQAVSFTVTVNGAAGGIVTSSYYTIEGTAVAPIYGPPVTTLIGAPQPTPTPTPSGITISGRVTTPTGLALRNAIVSLIDAQSDRKTATTSSFGLYSFDNVPTGSGYFLTVFSKRYRFTPKSLTVSGSMTNVDFVGLE